MPTRSVIDNPDANRYELHLDGRLSGVVEYHLEGDTMTIPHVEVLPELHGHGYSEPFLEEVLVSLDQRGLRVIPLCWYAQAHVAKRSDR